MKDCSYTECDTENLNVEDLEFICESPALKEEFVQPKIPSSEELQQEAAVDSVVEDVMGIEDKIYDPVIFNEISDEDYECDYDYLVVESEVKAMSLFILFFEHI